MQIQHLPVGLVLEGGGMRGAFTAGVLDFFLDHDLQFDCCLGVSAGACHACSFLSGQRGRAIAVAVDYLDDWRYCSLKSLRKTGDLFGAQMVYHTIPQQLNPYDYAAFANNPTRFYTVVTNCLTGEAEYRLVQNMEDDIESVRASSSLPLLANLVYLDGVPYLDGGISDSIPLGKSMELGNRRHVVVLTRDRSYRKGPNRIMPLLRRKYRDYPKLLRQLENRHLRYNETVAWIEQEEQAGNIFVIRPPEPVKIRRIEKDRRKLMELYKQGYDEASKKSEALLHYLAKSC